MNNGNLHLFEINGSNFVLDVESDTLHRVDTTARDIIRLLEEGHPPEKAAEILGDKYSLQELNETLHEIDILKKEGMLWAEPVRGTSCNPPVIKALCLNVAHSCNLACRYCFAGEGSYGGEPNLMSAEVGRAAVDFVLARSAGRKHVEVDYFGGEPLLNMPVVKDITSYARARGKEQGVEFRFTLTTNALLLDSETTAYLKDEDFSIVLSLDGRPGTHDLMRRHPGGGGSYERVKERILGFLDEWNDNYFIRGTFTRFNLDFSRDAAHMAELGFRHISLEPAVSSPSDEWALQEEDLPLLNKEYEKLAEYYLKRRREGQPFTFFHFEIDLDRGPCVYKRLSGCGAGEEYLAVTPGGDLFPCHQLIGDNSLKLGNVLNPGDFKQLPPETFPPAGPLYNECTSCWARYHCGGGCRAAAKLINEDFSKPYKIECALQKKRLECALYLKGEERQEARSKRQDVGATTGCPQASQPRHSPVGATTGRPQTSRAYKFPSPLEGEG